jgi:hypothetical protein
LKRSKKKTFKLLSPLVGANLFEGRTSDFVKAGNTATYICDVFECSSTNTAITPGFQAARTPPKIVAIIL